MKRRSLKTILALSLVLTFALLPLIKPQKAFAMADFKLKTYSATLSNTDVYWEDDSTLIDCVDIDITDDSCSIDKASLTYVGNADKIVSIKVDSNGDYLRIRGLKAGTCKIKIRGIDGGPLDTINITVTDSYMSARLDAGSKLGHICYGLTKIKAKSWKKTAVTVKIGKDSYKATTNDAGKATIALKKVYKMDTKVSVTFKKGDSKAKQTYLFENDTWMSKATAKKNTIKIKCYNLHKGDKVKIKYKKKVYSKKITKNYNHKYKVVTFKVKKKVKPNNTFVAVIYNKYKQPHNKVKWKVMKGTSTCMNIGDKFYGEYE